MATTPASPRQEPAFTEPATLLRTDAAIPAGAGASSALPADLLRKSVGRLRTVALLYAFVFFMSAYLPSVLYAEARARQFAYFVSWGPGLLAIAMALAVAAVTRSPRITPAAMMNVGLVFEVLSSYGIAAAEMLDPRGLDPNSRFLGLSWVAVWTLFFTVVVPTRPSRAVAAALGSVSAVPVMVKVEMVTAPTAFRISDPEFFFGLVFPYLLVVLMAYVGARVVYALGAEVRRARELGSYRLVERLGEGGMGEVWRADHLMLARPAAIKLIRPALSGTGLHGRDEARRRFAREAQAIASLRSPHTVELFDFGVAEDGAFYYVMELLEGLDADALVRRHGPMPPERVIHVLAQMCHSLSEAQSCGLVHRDIKPANVFLCRLGEDHDFVKVLDFGLVHSTRSGDEAAAHFTRENAVPGTPAFIAPEQAMRGGEVDGRADIYATGCVAYWLLTGQLVFEADSAMAMLVHHAKTEPVPPSARTELPVPPALDALVLACLAKDPAARPQTARELARRLAAVPGLPAWSDERAREWWDVHRPAPRR